MKKRERCRRVHTQSAARLRLKSRDLELHVVERGNRMCALSVELCAGLRETEPTCGAIEEAHTQPLFETRHGLAHHRLRRLEGRCGGRETAEIHDLDESSNVREVFHRRRFILPGHGIHAASPDYLRAACGYRTSHANLAQ